MSDPTSIDRYFVVSRLEERQWLAAKLIEVELSGHSFTIWDRVGPIVKTGMRSIGVEQIEVAFNDPRAKVLWEAFRGRLLLRATFRELEGDWLDLCLHTPTQPAVKHPRVEIATSDTSIIGAILQRKEEHPNDPGWWRFGRPVWVPEHLVPEASDEVRWTWGNRNAESSRRWELRQRGLLPRPVCTNPDCGKTLRGSAFPGGLCRACWWATPAGLEHKREQNRQRTRATRARQRKARLAVQTQVTAQAQIPSGSMVTKSGYPFPPLPKPEQTQVGEGFAVSTTPGGAPITITCEEAP